jgi:hypothetical protein
MVVWIMGLFSRKKKDDTPREFTSSKEIHDDFSVYVNEAKFVGQFFGLNFESLDPHEKVFSFLLENPKCVAFIVPVGEGIHLIQCVEGEPIVLEFPYSEITEVEILEDYESDELLSGSHELDDGEVRHLRTPRLAMSLVTKDQSFVLIAHAGQVDFVAGYLQAGILFSAR